jgi:hypothetical protein
LDDYVAVVGVVVLLGNDIVAVEDFLFGLWFNEVVLEYISKDGPCFCYGDAGV